MAKCVSGLSADNHANILGFNPNNKFVAVIFREVKYLFGGRLRRLYRIVNFQPPATSGVMAFCCGKLCRLPNDPTGIGVTLK